MTDPSPPSPQDHAYARLLVEHATAFYRTGDWGIAEAYAREAVRAVPGAPEGHAVLGSLGLAFGQLEAAWRHFENALAADPDYAPAAHRLARLKNRFSTKDGALAAMQARRAANAGKSILVKAWAYGFWADVFHVLGQALLAEISGRQVVTDWGQASLYWWPDEEPDIFRRVFVPLSDATPQQTYDMARTCWPPKWTPGTLNHEVVNRWFGKGSRLFGMATLARTEDVIVSDFVTAAHAIARWLPSDHPDYGKPFDTLFARLFTTYLHPRPVVTDTVDAFRRERIGDRKTLAVHVRGDNKAPDAPDIADINAQTLQTATRWMAERPFDALLLITDSNAAIDAYRATFGDKLITTEALRPDNERSGIYLERTAERKRQATLDIMVDTYLAASCDGFIGNGWSNVSVAAFYAGRFESQTAHLLGANVVHEDFFSLYEPRPEQENHDRFDID